MSDPAQPDLNDRLHNAIVEALRGEGTLMVNRVVVLAEVMDDDGEVSMFVGATPGTKAWQSVGMLRYAISLEDSSTVEDRLKGDL